MKIKHDVPIKSHNNTHLIFLIFFLIFAFHMQATNVFQPKCTIFAEFGTQHFQVWNNHWSWILIGMFWFCLYLQTGDDKAVMPFDYDNSLHKNFWNLQDSRTSGLSIYTGPQRNLLTPKLPNQSECIQGHNTGFKVLLWCFLNKLY